MTSKPAVVIVPGSFGRATFYAPFVSLLYADGFDCVEVVNLPSVGKKGSKPAASVADDAEAIQAVIESVAEEGWDILLVAHSYGGIPATESIKGMTKKDRAAQGKPGGIVRALYTTAIVPEVGGDLSSVMGTNVPTSIRIDGDYMYHEDKSILVNMCFNEMPFDEALVWAKRFPHHSAISFASKLTYPGHKDVPVSFMFCEKDVCITPEMQQTIIDTMEKDGKKVAVYKYPVDHIPYFSKLDSVLDAVHKACDEKN